MIAKKGRNKKTRETVLFSVVFILLFFGITGFLVISNWNINQKRSDLDTKIESLRKQIQDMEERKAQLEKGLDQSQSLDSVEALGRNVLDYKKPDEDVVVVKQPASTTQAAATQTKNFWQTIKDKIGF